MYFVTGAMIQWLELSLAVKRRAHQHLEVISNAFLNWNLEQMPRPAFFFKKTVKIAAMQPPNPVGLQWLEGSTDFRIIAFICSCNFLSVRFYITVIARLINVVKERT